MRQNPNHAERLPPEPEDLVAREDMIPEAHLQSACCELVADVARSAGLVSLRVLGSSMLPAIQAGDVLTVQRQNSHELRSGQVILYKRNGKLTAHRIVRVLDDGFLTRGDSLPKCDLPVQWSEVVGRVVGVHRNGSSVLLERSPWQRGMAAILRRSEFCTRLYLRTASNMRGGRSGRVELKSVNPAGS